MKYIETWSVVYERRSKREVSDVSAIDRSVHSASVQRRSLDCLCCDNDAAAADDDEEEDENW